MDARTPEMSGSAGRRSPWSFWITLGGLAVIYIVTAVIRKFVSGSTWGTALAGEALWLALAWLVLSGVGALIRRFFENGRQPP